MKSPKPGARHHLSPQLLFCLFDMRSGGREGKGGGEEERETRRKDDVRWQWDGSTWWGRREETVNELLKKKERFSNIGQLLLLRVWRIFDFG